jgi:hypothetical protein
MIRWLAPGLALLLLAGIGMDRSTRQLVPEGAQAYHQRMVDDIALIPFRFGDWVGVDTEIRQEALRILDANVSLSRTYRNVNTGRSATLLVVQCKDARSLLGHYPPVCYPTQGWASVSREPHAVEDQERPVHATEYLFEYDALGQSAQLGVFHFTVLPDGRTAPDMALLDHAARDRRTRAFGGASVQIVVDANLSVSERHEIYVTLVSAVQDWLHSLDAGIEA